MTFIKYMSIVNYIIMYRVYIVYRDLSICQLYNDLSPPPGDTNMPNHAYLAIQTI